jgi:hypothetical protein
MGDTLDFYFKQWCERQPPDKYFEWGVMQQNGKMATVHCPFRKLKDAEKRMLWEMRVWPVIAAIE